jgi:hypothetical protein
MDFLTKPSFLLEIEKYPRSDEQHETERTGITKGMA